MKLSITFILTPLIFLASCSTSREKSQKYVLSEGTAESVGLSQERLNNIDRLLQAAIDSGYYADLASIIVRKGKIVQYGAFGSTDENSTKPLSKDAIFRIASQTKAITSVAVMMLYEEGKFLLDEKIEDYLPEFKEMNLLETFDSKDSSYTSRKLLEPIRIRHLLNHTSGLDYFGFGNDTLSCIYAKNGMPSIFGSDQYLLQDFSLLAAKMPLHHAPGEKFTYGINTDILGRLVEVVSGMSLNDFFNSRIFEPLGMKDTYFYLPESKKERLVPVFVTEDGKLSEIHGKDEFGVGLDYPLLEGIFYSGGAGLSSTLMDYAIFLQMMLNGGEYDGKRLISRRTVEMMTSNQIGDLSLNRDKFGLGFLIKTTEGQRTIGESAGSFSWGGYYGTIYWADTKEQLIGLLFTNQRKAMPGNVHEKFKAMVYASLDD
ncbi:MAG: CubicO group peptidase (beta-lactamase class C family) [Cyclobacteriaceae bacterium]|jgi:CubicO group peptidase (beta-lactamase class C family)